MKKLYFLSIVLLSFLISCNSNKTVTSAITEKPASGTITAVYDEANTAKSISIGDSLDNYIANFELTYNDGSKDSSITVTKEMISLDTSTVGDKIATISYKGLSTTVSAIVCSKASDFTVVEDTITSYSGSDTSIIIPRYINGTEISILGNAVFKDNSLITNVQSNYISSINNGYYNHDSSYSGTFAGCTNLTSINFSRLTSIGSAAFAKCNTLSSFHFPKVTYIGHSAFYKCTNLKTVDFPLVTSVYERTFFNCSSLTTALFPSASYIGDSAFNDCTYLETICFPKVSSIGSLSFFSCVNLKTADFPSVTSIGALSFEYCKNLKTANFPAVTSIKCGAFNFSYSLTSLTFGTLLPPTLEPNIFTESGSLKKWTIYVPIGTKTTYENAFSNATNTFYNTSIPTYIEY